MLTLIQPLDVTFALLSQPITTFAVEFAINLNVSLADVLSESHSLHFPYIFHHNE